MNNIEKMAAARAKKAADGNTKIITNPIVKWEVSDKKSRSLAIAAYCAGCQGCSSEHIEPGFRTNIKECEDIDCSLYTFRPYKC